MARYHGRRGRMYMAANSSDAASPCISLSEWSLTMDAERIEVTSQGDTNKTYVQGDKDTQGTFSGYWDNAEDKMFDAADSAGAVKMYLYPSLDAATIYFYGTAWVSASLSTSSKDANKVSGSFAAATSWGRKP